MNDQDSPTSSSSSAMLLVIYWTIVGIPLIWGVYNTCLKVKVLFT